MGQGLAYEAMFTAGQVAHVVVLDAGECAALIVRWSPEGVITTEAQSLAGIVNSDELCNDEGPWRREQLGRAASTDAIPRLVVLAYLAECGGDVEVTAALLGACAGPYVGTGCGLYSGLLSDLVDQG